MTRLDLGGAWSVKQAETLDAGAGTVGDWIRAQVPGCVHLDLLRAGRIPDPFYGANDQDVQWVAEARWLYRRTFDCPAQVARSRCVDLVCEGLDTFAELHLNGTLVGRADNMFCEWRWNVAHLIREGENELSVVFESPRTVAADYIKRYGALASWCSENQERNFIRKAQYEMGWDWGPDLNTAGVWKPIYLEAYDWARIEDVAARIDWSDPARPVVNAQVSVQGARRCQASIEVALSGHGFADKAELHGELQPGANTLTASFPVEEPRLWWPAGWGEQALYELTVRAACGEDEIEERSLAVGLRRVELRREKDEEGESFVIHVNGEPIFCKGANWIPADSFLARVPGERYGRLVRMAADANMNMLRAWGGGAYESDEFYDECDRLGLMVWQDFEFSCAQYPDNLDWFCDSVRREAEQNVRRLRNHPSLVLWCGNNENQMFYETDGDWPGRRIYHELLPEVCGALDPDRPYWPGSPYGGARPASMNAGDQHLWDVWHGMALPDLQTRTAPRFVSEFGMQAPPAIETIRDYIPASEHHMLSPAMEHHNRAHMGMSKLYYYLSAMYRVPAGFAETVYLMQLMQAETVKAGVEHWRSRKFLTAGALFWQFNDCWPVTSWSCVDYADRPKALYYYARRFFAPVLPVLSHVDGVLSVGLVNDLREPFTGELICGFGGLDGYQQWVERLALEAGPNSVLQVLSKETAGLETDRPEFSYFWCRLLQDGGEIASNTALLLPPKHVDFQLPEWEVRTRELAPGRVGLRLATETLACGVELDLEGAAATFSDNFLTVLPEVPAAIVVETDSGMDAEEVGRRLRIRSLADVRLSGPEA